MKRINFLALFVLLSLIVLFSVGKTLQYYFFTDDYVFLYYLRHNLNFGWPYSSVLSVFRPVYQVFGINPLPYFTLALITHFLASVSVFFFAKKLTKNLIISSSASLIFATGYIGLDHFGMIAVSIINNLNVINVCITLILWLHWTETGKKRFFFFTYLMYSLSLYLFPYRAYPLVLFLPTIDFIKSIKSGSVKKLVKQSLMVFLRFMPFLITGIFRGIFSYGTNGTDHVDLLNLLGPDSRLYTFLNPIFFGELFSVLGKFVFIKPITDILGQTQNESFFAFGGLFVGIAVFLMFLVLLKRKKYQDGRNLLLLLFLIIESYVGNMFLHVNFDVNGPINRYLTISFFFYAIFPPLFLYLLLESLGKFKSINKKWALALLTVFLVISLTSMTRKYEDQIIEDRSKPAVSFFNELKEFVPEISDLSYNVFYFDRASYYPVSHRFGNVLLSAAMGNSVNLALPYNVSVTSIKIVDNFDDFLRFVAYPPTGKKVNYFTFYNDEKGLRDTSEDTFKLLNEGKITNVPTDSVRYGRTGNLSSLDIDINDVKSLTPLRARVMLRAYPLNSDEFMYPYPSGQDPESAPDKEQKAEIFQYLLSRGRYYASTNVDVESIHVGKKNPASFLIDDNVETSWISDQSRWEVGIKPWIKLDLSQERSVSKLVLTQTPGRFVNEFNLSLSKDGESWVMAHIQSIKRPEGSNLLIIDFDDVDARFVKLTIESVIDGPSPGLSEIEVVDTKFSEGDIQEALNVKNSPFEYIRDAEELQQIYGYLTESTRIRVKTQTNRDDLDSFSFQGEFPILLDGQSHEYTFDIPQGGTVLKKIKLEIGFPVYLFVDSLIIENKSKETLILETQDKCKKFQGVPVWKNPFDCESSAQGI